MKKLLIMLMLIPMLAFGTRTITLSQDNTINFNESFSGIFVASKQIEAMKTCASSKSKEIYVVLYTPGGSISAGQLFFDTINALPCKFHTITIFAASMGYQTVQNLGERLILPSGTLMSHRASISGLSGELGGELESVLKNLVDSVNVMEKHAANRVGISVKDYQDLIRDELWMTADQAVKTGHADEVVLVKCDESLLGTTSKVVRTFFGSYEVEYSDCPIVTAPVSVDPVSSKYGSDKFYIFRNKQMKNIKTTL